MKLKICFALFSLSCVLNAQKLIDKEFLFPNGSLTSTDGTVSLTDISYSGEHRNSSATTDNVVISADISTSPACTKLDKGIYYIADGAGLVFNAGSGSDYQDYSVSFLFKFEYTGWGYGRIIDFSNGTKDSGIYRYGGYNLNFYPNGNVLQDAFRGYDDKYVLLTLTRSKEGYINVYFNKKKVVDNYNDSINKHYLLDSSGNFIFIKDDIVVQNEDFPAKIAYLRVTNTILSNDEVINIYDKLCDKINNDNATLSVCYKPATSGTALDTKVGITALGRAGEQWPMERKGGYLALEAKTKGFVLNRVAFDTENKPIGIPEADYVEGMVVYDTTNNCLKIYTSTDDGNTYGWYCFNTQTCPKE